MSKSAREMFEELGYTYQESYFEEKLDEINYAKKGRWTPQIHFSISNKCVSVYRIDDSDIRKSSHFSTNLLQAINQQIIELGWLDE